MEKARVLGLKFNPQTQKKKKESLFGNSSF
jgi:hypothetical protein